MNSPHFLDRPLLGNHGRASLYDAFPPAQVRTMLEWLELHYTPKHGSWLNVAEVELRILARQCLGRRRLGNLETMKREVEA